MFLASWTDPAKDAERIQWVRDYYQALAPYSEPGGYINFMQDDDYHKIQASCPLGYLGQPGQRTSWLREVIVDDGPASARRLLGVFAHPDDEVFCVAARWPERPRRAPRS